MFNKKEYMKQYNKARKEKLKEWRKNNPEKVREYQKRYSQKNKEKMKIYYQENKNIILLKRKEYYQKNKEQINQKTKEYYQKNIIRFKELNGQHRHHWKQLLKEYYGQINCSKCGYDGTNFSAYDFHHINPEKKEYDIGRLLHFKPTTERIKILKEEIKKGYFVCATCHRIIHHPNDII